MTRPADPVMPDAHELPAHDLPVPPGSSAAAVLSAAQLSALTAAQKAQLDGRLDAAEAGYRGLLSGEPAIPAALNGLGLIHRARGRHTDALACFQQAAAIDPESASYANNLGLTLNSLKRPAEAEAACRTALRLRPDYPEAWNNLGNAVLGQEQPGLARACYREALRHRRDYRRAWQNLARVELAMKNHPAALRAALRALKIGPDAGSWAVVAQVRMEERDHPAALEAAERACALNPSDRTALAVKAMALRALSRYDAALAVQQALVEAHPDDADAWNELGLTLDHQNRCREAEQAYNRALTCLSRQGTPATAAEGGSAPVVLSKDQMQRVHQIRMNRAMTLLKRGAFQLGWQEYGHRWAFSEVMRSFPMPQWQGEPLHGRHLIVASEQGMGDNLQFIRLIPDLRDRFGPGRVTLAATTELAPLLRGFPGVDALVVEKQDIPDADRYCLLLDLPRFLGLDGTNIPARVPYLEVPAPTRRHWQARVAAAAAGRRTVGIAWQGNPKLGHDHHRSFPLRTLAPLFDIPGIAWIVLQKGHGIEQAEDAGLPLIQLTGPDDSRDLADTAAIVQALDLTLVPDSMLAHLAGGLGQPVWVPLASRSEWRWLTEGDQSPWYPTLRLFRQDRPGDWTGVVGRIAAALADWVTADPAGSIAGQAFPDQPSMSKLTPWASGRVRP